MNSETSVVICAYTLDRWSDLCRAIQSVRSQWLPPKEIILVIDHNGELEQRAEAAFPSVTVIPNGARAGLSGARNSGVAIATGELVAFLDDDAFAHPDWLRELLPAFDDPQVMGAGGSAIPEWATHRPVWFPEEFDWVIGCSYRGLPNRVAQVRNALGCNMAFRRHLFTRLGGFRSDLGRVGTIPTGAEETEFCIRLRNHDRGWQVVYIPGSRVQHRVPAGRATWRYFLRRCYGEGLSKAQLRRVAGARQALAAERQYATKTLPTALARLVRNVELRKASMIVLGFIATVAGFTIGSLRRVIREPAVVTSS